MKIKTFELERYFDLHEFSARYLLSASDCEPLSMYALLELADGETRALWEWLKLSYTETRGHPLLREEIALLYENIEADDVIVGVPQECIFLFMHAVLKEGDRVVCTDPAYQSLQEVARSIGCEVAAWRPDEEAGWRFDPEKLKDLTREDTKLIIVNFPHNPTGSVPPVDDYRAIVDIARERGAYLFSDEMYRYLEVRPGVTLPAGCEVYERGFSLFGMSKTFGLPGLRVGWLASRDREVLSRMNGFKDYTTICSSAPSEILAIAGLRSGDAIIRLQNERIARNIASLDGFFEEYGELISWNRPIGGSICLPRMHCVDDARPFCDELLNETGIMLVPSEMFQYGKNHVRFGFGRENLPEVLERFSRYLKSSFLS